MHRAGSPDNEHQAASTPADDQGPGRWALLGVGACFALSGFAALLYQTAWLRQFSLVFGTSEIAVATVLAAYMGGLALGARLIERYVSRVHRAVLVYGVLEFGVALSALAVPLLLFAAEKLMNALIGQQPEPPASEGWVQSAFYLLTAFGVLVMPTALMGATLPLLTRHVVRTESQIARRTGLLYAINTLGAVGGALVAAFVLLPQLGLRGTVYVGAAINVIVFAIAASLSRWGSPRSARAVKTAAPAGTSAYAGSASLPSLRGWRRGPQWILPLMLLSGAVSFVYEVLWTRLLSFVLGGSVYAFATMVASFLLGIAGGSAAAAAIARTQRIAQIGFIATQVAIAACSIAVYLAIDALVPARAGLDGNVTLAIAVLLPSTLFIGATFPFAVRILTDDPRAAAAAAARTYAWNTVGAILGATLAGFVLIPELRFEGAIRVAVTANVVIALLACLAIAARPLVATAALLIAAVSVAVGFRAPIPERVLRASPLNVDGHGTRHYYDVGRSATVVMLEQDGALLLRTNGLPEALIDLPGSSPRFSGEFWLSPLAVVARPQAQSLLVVGYGGGVVVEAIPPSIREVDVIELEPKVIDANRALRNLRARDPLADRRVNVIINDARGALALTTKRYDAIVSQPSHPWTAGASHLYTREFLQQARAHLSDGGVFVQWMNVSFLDEELLRSLTATLLDVFGQVRIYRPDPNTLVFLASTQPLDVERELARSGLPLFLAPKHYARFGMRVTEDLLTALVIDQQGAQDLARGAELITDDRNRMATAGAYDRSGALTPAVTSDILEAYDPLQQPRSWIFTERALNPSFAYMARRMALFSALDPGIRTRVQRMASGVPDPATSAYVRSIAASLADEPRMATRLMQEALGIDPANQQARFELIRPFLPALALDRAPDVVKELAAGLSGSAAAVVQAGRFGAAREWGKLPPMDASLRSTQWTDAWNFESAQIRVEWRTRVSNPEVRARFGREALTIIDDVIVAQPTAPMYSLRARAALAAQRPDIVIEAISSFARVTLVTLPRASSQRLPELRSSVQALIETIDGVGNDPGVRTSRRDEVRAQLLALRDRIEAKGAVDTKAEAAPVRPGASPK